MVVTNGAANVNVSINYGKSSNIYNPSAPYTSYGLVNAYGNIIYSSSLDYRDGNIYLSYNDGNTFERKAAPNESSSQLTTSSDGKYIIRNTNSNLRLSNNYGDTWNSYSIGRYMQDPCMSLNGKYQIFPLFDDTAFSKISRNYGTTFSDLLPRNSYISTVNGNVIYAVTRDTCIIMISYNSGLTFQSLTSRPCLNSTGISSSDSGRIIVIADEPFKSVENQSSIYLSSNYGNTFIKQVFINRRISQILPSYRPIAWHNFALSTCFNYLSCASGQYDEYAFTSKIPDAWSVRTSSGKKSWISISSSYDGIFLAACSDFIYTSNDSGASWTVSYAVNPDWRDIVCSADGPLIFACSPTTVYVSNNSGSSWSTITNAGFTSLTSITASANGQLVAVTNDNGYIAVSTDSGANWTQLTSIEIRKWGRIEATGFGEALFAYVYDTTNKGYIYNIVNNAGTWTSTELTAAGLRVWTGMSVSPNGQNIAACATGAADGYIYVSLDGGTTWLTRSGITPKPWSGVRISASGLVVTGTAYNEYIYTSTDYGENWFNHIYAGIQNWSGIISSYNGTKLAAITDGHYIYTTYLINKSPRPSNLFFKGVDLNEYFLPASLFVSTSGYSSFSDEMFESGNMGNVFLSCPYINIPFYSNSANLSSALF
jgi:hypothetical protein